MKKKLLQKLKNLITRLFLLCDVVCFTTSQNKNKQVTSCELRVTSGELRIESLNKRVEIQK